MVIKLFAGALGAGAVVVLAVPLLFSGGDAGEAPSGCPTSVPAAGDIEAIASTIRAHESGGDYEARARGSSASGAYQFTDHTWAGHAGYASAWQAPPAVQDARAADQITRILAANDGEVSAVPVVWYLGYVPPAGDPAWDRVPNATGGNRLTPREYQTAWLEEYAARSSGGSSPTCATGRSGEGVPLATVEGITVHQQIASRVAGLVQAARADGIALTGSGYRSPQRQIELRRQNCGTSDYAVYEMPSSSCSPPTARPGSSNHERGQAIDFSCDGALIRSRSSPCYRWLAQHAATYGLYNLESEPWHWSTSGS